MTVSKKKIYAICAISISISIAVIIIALSYAAKTKKQEPTQWVLHAYGNNVALYNGENIIEVYGSIMLDTLPEEDRRQLDNGIAFLTREEAVSAIEDYDG